MFSKNLSLSVLRICSARGLTYEKAAELCNISARHFGSIARGKTVPSVDTLEKICTAFGCSPNELLGYELDEENAACVTRYREQLLFEGKRTSYPVCPKCFANIDREYQNYCSSCGQKLSWEKYDRAVSLSKKRF